ncbi:MAG: HEAT repeat domain-containing protein [Bdellovibrionales bacterium]
MRKLIFCLIFSQAFSLTSAMAGSLRSIKEVKEELDALHSQGLALRSLTGIDQIEADGLIRNVTVFIPLVRDLSDFLQGGAATRATRIHPEFLRDKSVHVRVFRVLVELHRHGLRSPHRPAVRSTIRSLKIQSLLDLDLIGDLLALALQTDDSELRRDIGDALGYTRSSPLELRGGDGVVDSRLDGIYDPDMEDLIVRNLLGSALSATRDETARKVSELAKAMLPLGSDLLLSLEHCETLITYIKNRWNGTSLAKKRAIIDVLRRLTTQDSDVAERLIALDESKRILPLRVALTHVIGSMAEKHPFVAEWLQENLLIDPSPAVRRHAAEALAQSVSPSVGAFLFKTFEKESHINVKSALVLAIGRHWQRRNQPEIMESVFAELAEIYRAADGELKHRLGRALNLWWVPGPIKAFHGIEWNAVSCGDSLVPDNAAPTEEEEIWAAE